MNSLKRTLTDGERKMVVDIENACSGLTFIEEVKIVGSISSGCGLVEVSDLDIWIITKLVVDDMEDIIKKNIEDAGFKVS